MNLKNILSVSLIPLLVSKPSHCSSSSSSDSFDSWEIEKSKEHSAFRSYIENLDSIEGSFAVFRDTGIIPVTKKNSYDFKYILERAFRFSDAIWNYQPSSWSEGFLTYNSLDILKDGYEPIGCCRNTSHYKKFINKETTEPDSLPNPYQSLIDTLPLCSLQKIKDYEDFEYNLPALIIESFEISYPQLFSTFSIFNEMLIEHLETPVLILLYQCTCIKSLPLTLSENIHKFFPELFKDLVWPNILDHFGLPQNTKYHSDPNRQYLELQFALMNICESINEYSKSVDELNIIYDHIPTTDYCMMPKFTENHSFIHNAAPLIDYYAKEKQTSINRNSNDPIDSQDDRMSILNEILESKDLFIENVILEDATFSMIKKKILVNAFGIKGDDLDVDHFKRLIEKKLENFSFKNATNETKTFLFEFDVGAENVSDIIDSIKYAIFDGDEIIEYKRIFANFPTNLQEIPSFVRIRFNQCFDISDILFFVAEKQFLSNKSGEDDEIMEKQKVLEKMYINLYVHYISLFPTIENAMILQDLKEIMIASAQFDLAINSN